MTPPGTVIIGGGQAGHQLAVSLREGGYEQAVTMVEAESRLPYQRPPLSKDYLLADDDDALDLAFVADGDYAERGVRYLSGMRALSIDRVRQEVVLDSASLLPYEHLVLATGARARTLPVPGATLTGVHTLRSLEDAQRLRSMLSQVTSVVVVGAGFIGLEFATSAARLGRRVTVLERGARILRRSLSEPTAEFLARRHAAAGVTIITSATVAAVLGLRGKVSGVRLRGGQVLTAELVVVGVGVDPNDELAAAAGLTVDDGIVADEQLRTSDPAIFAIGDVASFRSGFAPGLGRVESVQNAVDQARSVARTLVGHPSPYADLPWFWTRQAGHLVQIAGIGTGSDAACVRPTDDPLVFSTFCYRAGRLVAIESVGLPRVHMQARRLLAAGISISPGRVLDRDLDLAREFAARQAPAVSLPRCARP
jgi:3-phenylpropionate/trans-cinnamate dioxygenase ferredoxin reductase component